MLKTSVEHKKNIELNNNVIKKVNDAKQNNNFILDTLKRLNYQNKNNTPN